MPTFAAIDIGSNSCRLAIASVQQHRLKTLYEDREVTRLGESVFRDWSDLARGDGEYHQGAEEIS